MNPSSQWVFPSTRRPISDPAIRRALGPLAVLSDDQATTDIFVTSDGRVFADRGSGAVGVMGLRLGQSESTNLARGLIEEGGHHLDEASPMVDVRLAEGMRVHAVLPPSRWVALPCRFVLLGRQWSLLMTWHCSGLISNVDGCSLP